MTCQMCVNKVKNTALEMEGVSQVSVDLGSGAVQISGKNVDLTGLKKAIESKGYKAEIPLGFPFQKV